MVDVEYLVLADSAVPGGGKQNLYGVGWDTISTAAVPVLHPTMAVAFSASVGWTSRTEPVLAEVDIVDEDGGSVFTDKKPAMTIKLGESKAIRPGEDQHVPVVVTLNGLVLPKYGLYAVVLSFNGVEKKRSRFRVVAAA